MKWNIVIKEKEYFSLSLTGQRTTIYTFGKPSNNGFLRK